MKKIVVALVMLVALFWSGGVVQAIGPNIPFTSVSITPDILDLGTLPFLTQTYNPPATLKVKVKSNCLHGPIVASMKGLKHRNGTTITPDHIYIKGPATGGFISMAKPVAISKPATGSHDILLNFRVKNNKFHGIAGKYTGTIVLTIMPPCHRDSAER